MIGTVTITGLILLYWLGRRGLSAVMSLQRIPEARRLQLVTLVKVVRSVAYILLLVSAFLMLLSNFGVNVAPLLASAGVAGLALSLGAQSLIKDCIGGLLILAESQYALGDSIQVGNVSGQVEHPTLRATRVRATNGDLCIVPNGEVRVVANQSRGWSAAVVDLGVAYEVDLGYALQVLEESAQVFARDPELAVDLLEPPQVLGPTSLDNWAIRVRLMAKTQPGKQWTVARRLRQFLLAVCEREGIALPYPRQEVWIHPATQAGVGTGSRGVP